MPPAPPPAHDTPAQRRGLRARLAAAVSSLAALLRPSPPAPVPPPAQEEPAGQDEPAARPPAVAGPAPARDGAPPPSAATSPLDYRADAARHLYALNAARIYQGPLPPLLYAIGVLQVDIDQAGGVTGLQWLRAPRHAPEVVAEIERTARAAAPYPVPVRLGRVTYTDTWLWDQSGRFQLDTLTEGQL